MDVYFLRHGEAGDGNQWKGDDSTRPLTEIGVELMRKEAETLQRLKLKVDSLISSPYVRARQTADAIASTFGVPVEEDAHLAPGCTAKAIADVLHDHKSQEHVWLVGHEPSWSAIVGEAIGGADVVMKKGAVACIRLKVIRPLHGTLLWLATPALLGTED